MQGGSIQENLSKLLFKYRITPHSTTGIPPSERLMGRCLRSRLDLLFPDVSSNVEDKQFMQKLAHDNMKSCRSFVVGEEVVFAEDFSNSSEKWKVTSPLSFQIDLSNGKTVRRHVDNVRKRVVKEGKRSEDTTGEVVVWGNVSGNTEVSASEPAPVVTETSSSPTTSQPTDSQPIVQPTSQPTDSQPIVQPTDRSSTIVRRSVRIRHPPDRFDREPYS